MYGILPEILPSGGESGYSQTVAGMASTDTLDRLS